MAWIDGGRAFDGGDVSALEQALCDEIGKAQDRHLDTVGSCGDAQQRIGDHGGEELQADGIVVVAEEFSDL